MQQQTPTIPALTATVPDKRGRFGPYGGQFVPETLMPALAELEAAYQHAKTDPAFWHEFNALMRDYVGRPTPITTNFPKTLLLALATTTILNSNSR